MTKKYFAKYLPLDKPFDIGVVIKLTDDPDERFRYQITKKLDISRGPMRQFPPSQSWQTVRLDRRGDINNFREDGMTTMQLFLCTREGLKKGDSVIWSQEHHITHKVMDDALNGQVWINDSREGFPPIQVSVSGVFKIIGKISDEAVWVNEGDELDEADTEL